MLSPQHLLFPVSALQHQDFFLVPTPAPPPQPHAIIPLPPETAGGNTLLIPTGMMKRLPLGSPEVCHPFPFVTTIVLTDLEYWLSVENSTVTLDGYTRQAMTFNGTVPGPELVADWGDNLVIRMSPVMDCFALSCSSCFCSFH